MANQGWEKAKSSRKWVPRQGDSLTGTLTRIVKRVGTYGEYTTYYIAEDETNDTWYVSGKRLDEALEGINNLRAGLRLRILCTYARELEEDRMLRDYEVWVQAEKKD